MGKEVGWRSVYLSFQSNTEFPLNTVVGKLTTLDAKVNPLMDPPQISLTPLMPLPNKSPPDGKECHISI